MPSSLRCSPRGAFAAALVLVALVAGCTGTASPSPSTASASIAVTDAWVRPPMGPDRPAAGYLVITSTGGADALIGASSPSAMTVEIHETTAGESGMTGMRPVERIEIPAGGSATLAPGGYHLMLMQPKADIVLGATVELHLEFEGAGEVVVQAEVRGG